jgi:hypothetical protein
MPGSPAPSAQENCVGSICPTVKLRPDAGELIDTDGGAGIVTVTVAIA